MHCPPAAQRSNGRGWRTRAGGGPVNLPLGPAHLLPHLPELNLGLYPIVTSQYSSTTLYQVSSHIQ
jgi:hypothetical protein